MKTVTAITRATQVCLMMAVSLAMALAQPPGAPIAASSEASDQKPGSALVYNLFTSSVSNTNTEETEISVSNTNAAQAVGIRFFFINGSDGAVTQRLVTLNANQTAGLFASQVAPGVRGYVIAVAVNQATSCPVSFNFLRGSAHIKLPAGAGIRQTKLPAVALAALYTGTLGGCAAGSPSARLNFDGASYNRLPRVLAADSLLSRADGNDALLVVNRMSGSLLTNVTPIGILSGIVFDDTENPFEFSTLRSNCQTSASLSNSFPRLVPRFDNVIFPGRSGWLNFFATGGAGLLGAVINFNPNAGASAPAFSHGRNLHLVTLAPNSSLDIPVSPLPMFSPPDEARSSPSEAAPLLAVSAASFSEARLSPEAIVTIFAGNLSRNAQAAQTPLPTSLSGFKVIVRDNRGVEREAPLFSLAPEQINCLVPAGTAHGPAVVIVKQGETTVASGKAQIAAMAPGLFTANADGRGLPSAMALRVMADGKQRFEPVARFDAEQQRFLSAPIDLGVERKQAGEEVFLVLFGTGLRHRSSLASVSVKIGGLDAEVLYAGASPGSPGLDQINVRVPRVLAGRGEVEIVCSVDGAEANVVRVWIR